MTDENMSIEDLIERSSLGTTGPKHCASAHLRQLLARSAIEQRF